MNVAHFIARRYFLSRRKRNFINVLAGISMLGVALGTAALIIALSVFNGLENLIRSLYGTFDPDLKITATTGKSFHINDAFLYKVKDTEGVLFVSEIIEDNALLRYKDRQMVVKIKGVSENYSHQNKIDSMVIQGKFILKKDSIAYAVIGQGVKYQLNISLTDKFVPLQLWYPQNKKSLNINPETAFNRLNILPSGVFAIEKQYDDNYVFLPLSFTKELMNYADKRTSLEIKVKKGYSINAVKKALREELGSAFTIQNSDEQHASLLRAVKIEKLFVYLTFSFIIGIASFNIFFSLTMLAIDKKKDMAILMAMGAPTKMVRNIFLAEGVMIAITGSVTGLLFGLGICLLQMQYGFVSMGMESAVSDSYPVKLQMSDFLLTGITITLITIGASIGPALKAAKTQMKEQL